LTCWLRIGTEGVPDWFALHSCSAALRAASTTAAAPSCCPGIIIGKTVLATKDKAKALAMAKEIGDKSSEEITPKPKKR
jgi:hypothetical protein